jgi:outer membrane protein OmpA-like peptidoglycan-associated protein
MKKVFPILFVVSSIILPDTLNSQNILNRIKNRVNQRANNKVDNAIDKGLDEVEGKSKPKEKTSKEEAKKETKDNTVAVKDQTASNTGPGPGLTYTSKYDFVQGDKVIAFEDLSSSAIGDFPTRWNTNGSAEVVTINGKEGKWLKIGEKGVFYPEFIKNIPENFTLEFDLGVNNANYFSPLCLNVATLKKPEDFPDYAYLVSLRPEQAVHLEFMPATKISQGVSKLITGKSGTPSINNSVNYQVWDVNENKFAHISLWRQNTRLRVYLNGEKIWDSPRAFETSQKYNAITFAFYGAYDKEKDYYLLNNVRLAVGAPDTRNKLLTEGKFVTSGINFDVNSDRIRPDSYGVLKEIANVLKENEAIKIKIIGHTDSDGDDAKNMDLSKKRAESVRNALINDFQINASNLQTDGKGESSPVSKNDTPEGKAQNRRVEFIKM